MSSVSGAPPIASDLRAALRDLDGAIEEAQEDCFPQPSAQALKNARLALRDLYRLRPCRLETYPPPAGEVAIDGPGGRKQSVLVLCESDGGIMCLVNLDGGHRRARYPSATTFPDDFVREAPRELDRPD